MVVLRCLSCTFLSVHYVPTLLLISKWPNFGLVKKKKEKKEKVVQTQLGALNVAEIIKLFLFHFALFA